MSGLLPSESEPVPEQDGELRTLWLDNDDAGELLSSLASDTARSILTELHREPSTVSEVAAAVDTSLQNARHHLTNLEEAGLVRVADTRYSAKGREMNVYAPSREPMVVFVGREERKSGFLDSLKGLLGATVVLALASLLVQWTVGALAPATQDAPGTLPRMPDSVGSGGAVAVLDLVPPGALFFAGGLLVLLLVGAWSYWRRERPDPSPAV